MAPRASWKGRLQIGEIGIGIALHAAATTSDRVTLHMVNRRTGNRLRSEMVDSETGTPVADDDEVMGYELDSGEYVTFEPDELASAVPEAAKALPIQRFLPCASIDPLYFDRPYYLTPSDPASAEAFALLRDGMVKAQVAALASTVLFRRLRTLLIRPEGKGFIAHTLSFDYEVRSADEAFSDIPKLKIKAEMLDLAKHIISTKLGDFDPTAFDDRYDAALAALVKAKLEGRPPPRRKDPPRDKVVDLMEALRESARSAKGRPSPAKTHRRKAG